MRRLNINECHGHLLEIARVFDKICTENNIPYYMLGGTMLGAIRHKGFIPWDDDMDFGVPREYYDKLIHILETELPHPYRCCTYDNNKAVKYPFFKIEDSSTKILDHRVNLSLDQQLGLNVDVFPLDCCNLQDRKIKKVLFLLRLNQFLNVETTSVLKNYFKKFLRLIIPFSSTQICRKCDYMLSNLDKGPYLANVYGRWKLREFVPIQYYGVGERYKFKTITLCGFANFDAYLKQLYGEYMKLPPKEKQFVHSEQVYKIEG